MPGDGLSYSLVKQMLFRFVPNVVKAFVPATTLGVYALAVGDRPVYVGRSDTCVQRRLSTHELRGVATHFAVRSCATPTEAFWWESAWYHTLRGRGPLLNRYHPQSPAGLHLRCPFCDDNDCSALAIALRPRPKLTA